VTEFETRTPDWLSVEEALRRVLEHAHPTPSERGPLHDSLRRALAVPLRARATLPPWDNAAMDGYAVRSSDVQGVTRARPAILEVVGVVHAGGSLPATNVSAGTALRIMTGAPVPPGADSVIRVEDTDAEAKRSGTVAVFLDRDALRNVRPRGQDMRAGETVLDAGVAMGPGQVAVAAAAGHGWIDTHRPARVAILSSGDELRTLDAWDDVLHGYAIPETNGPTLAASVAAAGSIALPPRVAVDTRESLRQHILVSADADVLVTTGGASMGEADLLKRVLDELNFELVFWRVTLRPGSPVSFGLLPLPGRNPLPVFGLPGNPASAFVTFELFVRPFLLALGGHRRIHRPFVRATAGESMHTTARLTHLYRVLLREEAGSTIATLTGPQGSGLVQSLGRADGLAIVPPGPEGVAEGDEIRVMLLNDAPGTSMQAGYAPLPL